MSLLSSTAAPNSQRMTPRATINSGHILDGKQANINQHPWLVSLKAKTEGNDDGFFHICGGCIIDSRWILTVAHCLIVFDTIDNRYKPIEPANLRILAGATNINDVTVGRDYTTFKVIVHESFNINNKGQDFNKYDIGLIQINEEFDYTLPFIKALDITSEDLEISKGDLKTGQCKIAGWGTFSGSRLHEVGAPVVTKAMCAKEFATASRRNDPNDPQSSPSVWEATLEDKVCAGYINDTRGICKGDSGSPLVCRQVDDGAPVTVGLASYFLVRSDRDLSNAGCLSKEATYEAFTDVHHYRPWICEHTSLSTCSVWWWRLLTAFLPIATLVVCFVCAFCLLWSLSREKSCPAECKLFCQRCFTRKNFCLAYNSLCSFLKRCCLPKRCYFSSCKKKNIGEHSLKTDHLGVKDVSNKDASSSKYSDKNEREGKN